MISLQNVKPMYDVQVDAAAYRGAAYMTPERWTTTSLIVKEVFSHVNRGSRIVEIGPGSGLLTTILRSFGCNVTTLDLDPTVKPDIVCDIASVDAPERIGPCDAIIASEIFEHIQYTDFLSAMTRLKTVTPQIFMTIPHTTVRRMFFGLHVKIPTYPWFRRGWKLSVKKRSHTFNGQHYWELGTKQTSVKKVTKDLKQVGWLVERSYLNPENPYHHFFFLRRI